MGCHAVGGSHVFASFHWSDVTNGSQLLDDGTSYLQLIVEELTSSFAGDS